MRWPAAGGYIDAHRLALDLAPAAAALATRLLRHLALAATDIANGRADDLTERRAGHRADLPGPLTATAGLDRRPRLGAIAAAVLTQRDGVEGDLDLRTVGRLGKRDPGRGGDVRALHRSSRPAATAPAERRGKPAQTSATTEERLEDVIDRAESVHVGRATGGTQALVAVPVIGRAAVGVGEHLIRLGALLELGLCLRSRVDVGVQLAGQPTEGLLDVRVLSVAADAENLVVVTFGGTGTHRSS
jgi:hypothetical protein